MTRQPFDDIRALVSQLPPLDGVARRQAMARLGELPDGGGALGHLGEAVVRLAGALGSCPPKILKPVLILFAATHGCSPANPKVQAEYVAALAAGGMPVNVMCGEVGVGLKVFELALDIPTPNILSADAMSERDCAATIAFGMEALADQPDVVLLCHTGAGAGIAAAAVRAALNGQRMDEVDKILKRLDGETDPLQILRRVGGRDIAAMVGAIIAARSQKAAVILDGGPALAAAAICFSLDPDLVAHCIGADTPRRVGSCGGLLGVPNVSETNADSGYGTGAVLAVQQLKMAAAVLARAPSAKQLGLGA